MDLPEEENVAFKGASVLKGAQDLQGVQHLPFQMPPLRKAPKKIKKGDKVAVKHTAHENRNFGDVKEKIRN